MYWSADLKSWVTTYNNKRISKFANKDYLNSLNLYPRKQINEPKKFQHELTPPLIEAGFAIPRWGDWTLAEAKNSIRDDIILYRKGIEEKGFEWVDEQGVIWQHGVDVYSSRNLDKMIESGYAGNWFFFKGEKYMLNRDLVSLRQTGEMYLIGLFAKQTSVFEMVANLTTLAECREFNVEEKFNEQN